MIPVLIGFVLSGQTPKLPAFNPDSNVVDPAVEKRVADTLSQLTLEEKIDMIAGVDGFYTRNIDRLGIPRLKMSDGPTGVRNYGPTTAYPCGTALASSFDTELATKFGDAVGRDGRARGVHIWLAPGINLSRVPQNGRNFEYFGEDPLLAGKIAAAEIRGVQAQGMVATVKHYAANNHETDRMTDSADVDERTLREMYLKGFELAVKEGGVWAVMCSYNRVNGTYASENEWLLTKVLKEDWGFKGLVMSDWGAVHSALGPAQHGLDLEMPGPDFMNRRNLLPAVKDSTVSEEKIDDKVRRLLRLMYNMGYDKRPQEDTSIAKNDDANHAVALDMAREGTVLLKNSGILPLGAHKKIKNILIVGPNAVPAVTGGGGSSYTTPIRKVSLVQAIQDLAGPGVTVTALPSLGDAEKAAFAEKDYKVDASGKPGLTAEYFDNPNLQGTPVNTVVEPSVSHNWTVQGHPDKLPDSNFSVRWKGLYTPKTSDNYIVFGRSDDGIRVYVNNRLLIDDWRDRSTETSSATIALKAGRTYQLRVEYFQREGDAEVQFGLVPADSLANADIPSKLIQSADVVIAAVGFNPRMESEGADHTFALPFWQQTLLNRLTKLSKNVVVVNNSGEGVDMSNWVDKVAGIVQAWYPGGIGNQAVGEILFGKINPSGKLPTSFPKTLKGTYYEKAYPPKNGHLAYTEGDFIGYRWFDANKAKPLFPFGYGLSYTSFKVGGLTTEAVTGTDEVRVHVDVTNTGDREGVEVVQLYVGAPGKAVVRPVRELKGFQRVSLLPGEKKTVTFSVASKDVTYWDMTTQKWVVEPGRHLFYVGTSSRDLPLKGWMEFHPKP